MQNKKIHFYISRTLTILLYNNVQFMNKNYPYIWFRDKKLECYATLENDFFITL